MPAQLSPVITPGFVASVHLSPTHSFRKHPEPRIHLLAGQGVQGDAHCGALVQHRYLKRRNPAQPNLTQVHLLHAELFDLLRPLGFHLGPGDLGENITTTGIDLLNLPLATRLHFGPNAIVELTGLRTPCIQMNRLHAGLMAAAFHPSPNGRKTPRAGVMGIVLADGELSPGSPIAIDLPSPPLHPLNPV